MYITPFLSFISAFSIYNLILCLPFPKSHFTYYIVWKLAHLIFNPKIIQIRLILILCCQTGIGQITFFVVPFLQSTIIEQLQIILNNERNNIEDNLKLFYYRGLKEWNNFKLSSIMNGTILYFRHSLNIINLPTRPLPSWNG